MSHRFFRFFFFMLFIGIAGFTQLINLTSTVQAMASEGITGTVIETMNTSGYTYIHVDTGKEQQWVAIPETELKSGDTVTYLEGTVMTNFLSKSLDRTFPTIIFSPGLEGQKPMNPHGTIAPKADAPASNNSFAAAVEKETGKPVPQAQQEKLVSGGSAGAVVPFTELKVEKVTAENGYTVEEIFSKKNDLNGKTIRIRGKVVKYNPNIMGKNWIHIQDGTGNPMENTHDLVVTTSEQLTSEDIIVVEGKLAANKDFGAGYKYTAIVEEATVIK